MSSLNNVNVKRKNTNVSQDSIYKKLKTEQQNDKEIIPPENALYYVECIKGKRIRCNIIQYLVKWSGYDDSDNTWEPISNLQKSCQYAINDYELLVQEEKNKFNTPQKKNPNKQSIQQEIKIKYIDHYDPTSSSQSEEDDRKNQNDSSGKITDKDHQQFDEAFYNNNNKISQISPNSIIQNESTEKTFLENPSTQKKSKDESEQLETTKCLLNNLGSLQTHKPLCILSQHYIKELKQHICLVKWKCKKGEKEPPVNSFVDYKDIKAFYSNLIIEYYEQIVNKVIENQED